MAFSFLFSFSFFFFFFVGVKHYLKQGLISLLPFFFLFFFISSIFIVDCLMRMCSFHPYTWMRNFKSRLNG